MSVIGLYVLLNFGNPDIVNIFSLNINQQLLYGLTVLSLLLNVTFVLDLGNIVNIVSFTVHFCIYCYWSKATNKYDAFKLFYKVFTFGITSIIVLFLYSILAVHRFSLHP
jgi:hypothetical protein